MLNLCKIISARQTASEIDLRKRDSVENFLFSLLILNLNCRKLNQMEFFLRI
jgi:hypothetical protein